MKKCLIQKTDFWDEHPALLKGLTFLFGASSFLFFPYLFLWNFYLFLNDRKKEILIFLMGFIYSFFLYSKTPDTLTSGYFSIHSVQPYQSPFHKGLTYQGTLYVDGQSLPCTVRYLGQSAPSANCDYILKGKGHRQNGFHYLFKPKEWNAVPKTYSFAQFRYNLKEHFRSFLKTKLTRPRVASFLGSLVTGDVEDRLLRYEFSKVGLQHLLAISGFHFALLITFSSLFLSLFLSTKVKHYTLLAAILLYFLFVGNLPSVQRSVLMAALYLIAQLLSRNTTALNLLGVALLVETIADPLVVASLGFQLSFLSCFGILLFQPLFKSAVFHLFPKRDPELLSPLSLHAYFFAIQLRSALLLSLCVNLALFPVLLYHFHEFPLLSLLYNLFFPPLVSLALFILLFSLLLHLILPPLSAPFFAFTDFLTTQLLDIAAHPPPVLNYSITASHIAPWAIILYLFSLTHFLTNRHFFDYNSGVYSGDRSSVG